MDWVTLTAVKGTPGSIADWINDSRIALSPGGAGTTAALIVQEAEALIYGKLRHWRMMPPPVTGSMVQGQQYIVPPSDMLEPDFFMITATATYGKRVLRQRTMQNILESWQYDGNGNIVQQMPFAYWFDNTNLNFDSVPDQTYPYVFTYYQQPAPLSASNTTNFVTQWYPRMMRCAIMMLAAEWLKDSGQTIQGVGPGKNYWSDQFDKELAAAQMASDRAKRAVEAGPIMYGAGEGSWYTQALG